MDHKEIEKMKDWLACTLTFDSFLNSHISSNMMMIIIVECRTRREGGREKRLKTFTELCMSIVYSWKFRWVLHVNRVCVHWVDGRRQSHVQINIIIAKMGRVCVRSSSTWCRDDDVDVERSDEEEEDTAKIEYLRLVLWFFWTPTRWSVCSVCVYEIAADKIVLHLMLFDDHLLLLLSNR